MRRAYKFRAYPTVSQEGRAVRLLRDHCDLYNAALEERRDAWRKCNISVGFYGQCAQLSEIRKNDLAGQGRHSCTAQQQTLRRLDATFRVFFRRAKAKGPRVGYPRFKPYQRFNQVRFVAGDGAKWMPAGAGHWARASFQAVGHLKVRQHRPVKGRVKTLQLKRECRRWYVIVVAEADPESLPSSGHAVGIDVGVAPFLTTSDGVVVTNPRFLATAQARIARLQRRKERATLGSGNRRRLRRALAREWRKVRNQRRDFHHKTARALVDAYDVLALEDLRIGGLTASARGTVEGPGRNVAQKAGLNRSILDAGWGQFTSILVAKAESAGRRVVRVEPGYTSLDCHTCGSRCVRPRQDTVICPNCGEQDADRNGACNIATRAGLGSGQAHVA
ncbi:MAG: RNA-guided endonuclease InsQ/TnpB family protein [Actinomycetes bacterium]